MGCAVLGAKNANNAEAPKAGQDDHIELTVLEQIEDPVYRLKDSSLLDLAVISMPTKAQDELRLRQVEADGAIGFSLHYILNMDAEAWSSSIA